MYGAIMECRNIDGTISWNLDSSNIATHTGLPVGIRICVDRFVVVWTHRAKKHKEKIWGNMWILEIWENKWIIKFGVSFSWTAVCIAVDYVFIMTDVVDKWIISSIFVTGEWSESSLN